jgi:hypothetical protein
MDGKLWRGALVTGAFLTAVIALIVGAAGRGETTENTAEDICESAVWPRIPATCFSRPQPARWRPGHSMVDAGEPTALVEATTPPGFNVTSGKADLLQRPESNVRYRTVETRDRGVSILTRVEIGSRDQMH